MAKFGRPGSRIYIKRDDYIGGDGKVHAAWEVRWTDNGTLYAYAYTWWGAWCLACAAVGWKVPK